VLGPGDVGYRVVVRRFVGIREDRPQFSDALGRLVSLTDTDATLDTGRGLLVVPLDTVALAKRVPPAARDILSLERAAAAAWPAPETEPLGAWLLRAAEGWTNRANSALAIGSPGRPRTEALAATVDWYAARGLVPRITTPLPLATPVARLLASEGWTAQPTTLVQTGPVPVGDAAGVRLTADPDDEVIDLVAGWKGPVPAVARHILTAPPQVRFARLYDGSVLVGAARGVVTGDWFGISLVTVAPEARRRGLARRLVRALGGWATEVGATRCYLQVEGQNSAALALYERLGFATHHAYITWRLDGPGRPTA